MACSASRSRAELADLLGLRVLGRLDVGEPLPDLLELGLDRGRALRGGVAVGDGGLHQLRLEARDAAVVGEEHADQHRAVEHQDAGREHGVVRHRDVDRGAGGQQRLRLGEGIGERPDTGGGGTERPST